MVESARTQVPWKTKPLLFIESPELLFCRLRPQPHKPGFLGEALECPSCPSVPCHAKRQGQRVLGNRPASARAPGKTRVADHQEQEASRQGRGGGR